MGNCLNSQGNTPGQVIQPGHVILPQSGTQPLSQSQIELDDTGDNTLQERGNVTEHLPTQLENITASAPPIDIIQDAVPSRRLIVAAIDFGTTFSGYAFSFRHDYKIDPLKISINLWQHSNGMSYKAPTAVLIGLDRKVKSFGYDAEREYADLVQTADANNWYYFHRFKMQLYQAQNLTVSAMMTDISGKQLPVIDVFSGVIGYIKDHLLARLQGMDTEGRISESSIHWVLTVPAIWNDKAKQFMRKASQKAGIQSEHLTLSLEPEAASLFCRRLPTFNCATDGTVRQKFEPLNKGTRYMILDLGGGTADVTVHEIQTDGTLQELHQASGGYWGGTTVDEKFYNVLTSLLGRNVMDQVGKQYPHEILELQSEFEIKKRTFFLNQTKPVIIRVPISLVEVFEENNNKKLSDAISQSNYAENVELKKDKLLFRADLFSEFFRESVTHIINHIQSLLQMPHLTGISTILLIGGYSECHVVKETIHINFPHLRVVSPEDSGLAVLKGAVLFGHEPRAISSRVCKYTYGIAMTQTFRENFHPEEKRRHVGGIDVCDDVFDIHLQIGQKVKLGEDQPEKEYCLIPGQTKGILEVFASSVPNPRFVTEEFCTFLGSVCIECPEGFQNSGKIFVKLLYGGTELGVEAREEKTGKKSIAYCDFLG